MAAYRSPARNNFFRDILSLWSHEDRQCRSTPPKRTAVAAHSQVSRYHGIASRPTFNRTHSLGFTDSGSLPGKAERFGGV